MTAPYHLRLVTAFDFPPPCAIEPIDTLSDPIVGEFSELGRGNHSWSVVLLVFLAIFVPLVIALELWR